MAQYGLHQRKGWLLLILQPKHSALITIGPAAQKACQAAILRLCIRTGREIYGLAQPPASAA
jgi:hypothetical protein